MVTAKEMLQHRTKNARSPLVFKVIDLMALDADKGFNYCTVGYENLQAMASVVKELQAQGFDVSYTTTPYGQHNGTLTVRW